MTLENPINILVSDVTLNWAKLLQPHAGMYGPAWEVQISSEDSKTFEDLIKAGAKAKKMGTGYTINLRRKAFTGNGDPMDPVRVVDANKSPMSNEDISKIGNGSKGSVIVWAAPYDNKFGKGVTFSLSAVQVSEMVEYSPESNVDFEQLGPVSEGSTEGKAMF